MTDLKIDSEFKDLLPPLSDEKRKQLEENLLRDGIREPLTVWNGVLIDGHNRYEIAQKHGLHFTTVEKQFATRDEVKIWIADNQFGRRDLTVYERSLLAIKIKPSIAVLAKERMEEGKNQYTSPGKNSCQPKTSDETTTTEISKEKNKKDRQNKTDYQVAQKAGVSEDTIRKVEKIEAQATPEIKAALKAGDISINQAFKTVKQQEKQQEITDAKAEIAAQVVNDIQKPTLFIGDGINFTPDEPYKLLLTDPPYSTDVDDIDAFAKSWLPNALRHVRRDGFAYVFIGSYPNELRAYLNITPPEHLSLIQVLVWTYRNTLGNNPRDRYKQNWQACLFYRGVDAPNLDCPVTNEQWAVQDINAPDGRLGNRYHSWQKPDEIAERFIRHSTQKGDTVFDPFACTGTFLLAAAKLGRIAYGFEINPDNAQIAFERGCQNGGQFLSSVNIC